ncbi:MAG: cyclodeaminase/cyclohydrolase family protein [Vicinamibacterales bacterium]
MSLIERSVRDLIAAFRSSDPTPGGGSAAALAGALGAALLAMVASLGRPATTEKDDLERLAIAGRREAELSDELASLVDRDAEAYDVVMATYRLPKASDDEKRRRSERIQQALEGAIASPLDVMRLCTEAAEHATVIASFGNPNAASDVRVAVELLTAGMRGARANVEINLESLKDAARADEIRGEAARLAQKLEAEVDAAQARL